MSKHSHAWSVVMLGEEPVGIQCPCGQSRALDSDPVDGPVDGGVQVWEAERGNQVRVKVSGTSVLAYVNTVEVRTASSGIEVAILLGH